MRIRVKLTLLLLIFSLAPVLTIEAIDAISFARLSERVDEQVSAGLTRRVEHELALHVRRTSEKMDAVRRNIVMMARTQRAIFADTVGDWAAQAASGAAPPTDPERLVYRDGAFVAIASGVIPPGFQEQPGWAQGSTPPIVSYDRPVLIDPPDGAPTPPGLVSRLAETTPELDALSAEQREAIRSQFFGMTDGTHLAYPAKGGYGAYDPRTRSWYTEAVDQHDTVWVGPYTDAVTGEPRITCAVSVRDAEDRPVGVTGVDYALSHATDLLELPSELSLGSSSWVVDLDAPGQNKVILSTELLDPNAPDLTAADPLMVDQIYDELRAGRAGSRVIDFDGEPCIWAFGPIGPELGLIMIVPRFNIEGLVGGVRADLQSIADESSKSLIAVSISVVMLCFLGAYLMGRTVSRPIRRLADAAQAIRDGDLTARVRIRRRNDEVGKLARTFNDMVPALADRLRLRESIALANEIQQDLLPDAQPRIPGFDVFGIAVYCDETGGDYFDFLNPVDIGPGRHGLALGDVTGHGIPAALIMTGARALLQSHARAHNDAAAVLARMNETIARESTLGRFMTFVLIIIDTEHKRLEVANAGHDPALILHASDGTFEELPRGGLPLGISEDEAYTASTHNLPGPGDILLIGTDGIWETRNASNKMYGKERLREIVRTNADKTAEEISAAILEDLRVYRGQSPVLDDITFIVAKATG